MVWNLFPDRGPTCHPTPTPSALLCGLLSQLLPPPTSAAASSPGGCRGPRVPCAHGLVCAQRARPPREDRRPGPRGSSRFTLLCLEEGGVCGGACGWGLRLQPGMTRLDGVFPQLLSDLAAPKGTARAAREGTWAVPFGAARSLSNWGNTPSLCQVGSV